MDIRTKDGIVLKNVPDGTPDEEIKARIAKIRGGEASAPKAEAAPAMDDDWRKRLSPQNLAGAAVEPNAALLSGMVAGPASGLAGIAGAVLPGPEGQGADWVQRTSNALTYKPVTEGGKLGAQAVAYPFHKLAEGADWAGGKTADATGSPAAGAGVNTAIQALPLALAKFIKTGEPGPVSTRLMQSAVKPAVADLASGKGKEAMVTMLKEGINPTEGGMLKAQNLARELNTQVEGAIKGSPAQVSMMDVGSRLAPVMDKARTQVNPTSDINAVNATWREFAGSPLVKEQGAPAANAGPMPAGRAPDVTIPVQLAHELKKGTYRSLGEKSYGEMGTSSTEAQKALARGLREETLAAVPEVKAPLAREASLMNVKEVALNRALQNSNKDVAGLASLRLDNPIAAGSFLADRTALVKALLARGIYAAGNPKTAVPGSAAGMTARQYFEGDQ